MSAAKLPADRLRAESELRVRRALARIQRAQLELNAARSDLSALCGGVQVWKATGNLEIKVRALWYRVEGFRQKGRYRLDDTNIEEIISRDAGAAQS